MFIGVCFVIQRTLLSNAIQNLRTPAKVRKSSRKIRLFYFFDFMAQILKKMNGTLLKRV